MKENKNLQASNENLINKVTNESFVEFNLVAQNFDVSEKIVTQPVNNFKEFISMLFKNKSSLIGFIIVICMLIGIIFFPFIWTSAEIRRPSIRNLSLFSSSVDSENIKRFHLLGTDNQGRDLWASLWTASRFSLAIAAVVTVVHLVIGVWIGLLMGYSKHFDRVMQYFIKIVSNIPAILILIIMAAIFQPSFWIIVFGLTITGWIPMSLQVRAEVIKNRQLDYFVASKILGTPFFKKMLYFLPIAVPIIVTRLVFSIPGAILAEASLGFVGLSIANQMSLGNMIFSAKEYILLFPGQIIVPVIFLIILTISIQLIGNGIQDALKRGR